MNNTVTSKEDILAASREIISREGLPAVSIRSVAAACGVSVGSIYNYFDSKAELVGAAVESVWREIFHRGGDGGAFGDIQSCIVWMYGRMERGCEQYPGFFRLHSLSFMREDRPGGRETMQQTWRHILDGLALVLRRDPNVREGAFTKELTADAFAGVLFSLMLSAMLRQDYDPGAVLEIVRRTLY
ncbi:MAG: TetR/AcrR family transcriptional regulator [Oscillospiraceae bacterium]